LWAGHSIAAKVLFDLKRTVQRPQFRAISVWHNVNTQRLLGRTHGIHVWAHPSHKILHCQVFQIFWPQFAIRVLVVFFTRRRLCGYDDLDYRANVFALAWGMKFVLAFFLLTPLWAAGARRLQDTGEARKDIFIPAGVFFGPPIGLATSLVNAIFLNSFIGFLLLIFLFVIMIYFSFCRLCVPWTNDRQALRHI
jgi:uncharacterized membrane protein YhaH (DUF805 family)